MGQRFYFFPAALPDETLHSILSRYARLCGLNGNRSAFAGVGGVETFSQNVAFPCRLENLVDALPFGSDLTVTDVISRHTLLPYFQPFMAQQQVNDVCAMMAGHDSSLKFRLGVVASRLESSSRIRFCTSCVEQDLVDTGAAYWHRVHQLPGVLVCPHHGTVLWVLDDGWSRDSRQLYLPDDDALRRRSRLLTIPVAAQSLLRHIAVRSLQLLGSGVVAVSPDHLRMIYLRKAEAQSLASPSGRLRLKPLARHMSDFFSTLPPSWEYSVLSSPEGEDPASWVTKLLRKPRRTHHPLKHILLAQALEISNEELLAAVELQPSPSGILQKPSPPSLIALQHVGGRRQRFQDEYQVRQSHACVDYAWLYRNDRTWLSQHIALNKRLREGSRKPASSFRKLDSVLAKRILDCAATFRSHSGKPVWVSRTKVGRHLHVLSRFEKQLDRLPECAAALAAVCETREQFHTRRLRWAAAELRRRGKSITLTSLCLMASIRPCKEAMHELSAQLRRPI